MLNKLMKYEIKAMSKYLVPLYAILMLLSIVNRFVLSLDIFHGALSVIPFIVMSTYVISIISVIIVTLALMVLRFYKNLMGDEGYLMFTLPVSSHQLILSKLLIAMLWTAISIICVVVSIIIVVGNSNNIAELFSELSNLYTELYKHLGNLTILTIVEFFIMTIIGTVSNILMFYVSIAIGQLFANHKVLGSFGAYVVINIALQFIFTFIILLLSPLFEEKLQKYSSIPVILFPAIIFITLILNALYYYATKQIIQKKLNLE